MNNPEKVIACKADQISAEVKPHLENGYTVKHVVAEQVSISVSTSFGNSHNTVKNSIHGKIIFVLEKKL